MPSPQESEGALLRAALELTTAPARRAFLEQACAGDAELRQRLEAALVSREQSGVQTTPSKSPPSSLRLDMSNVPLAEEIGQMIGPLPRRGPGLDRGETDGPG